MQNLRNLSVHQFGTLRYVKEQPVTVETLEGVHGGTLWSLLHRKYLTKGEDHGRQTRIVLTRAGEEELHSYTHAEARQRAHVGDLTERCARMLRVARLLHFPRGKAEAGAQAQAQAQAQGVHTPAQTKGRRRSAAS